MIFINGLFLLISVLIIQKADYVSSNQVQAFSARPNVVADVEDSSVNVTETLFDNGSCNTSAAIENFPTDLLSNNVRRQGAILLHLFVAFYFFIILGTICSRYFIPSVECICLDLKIPPNVAAATFMSLATTTPEFFTNAISTFIADSNMGMGTIIGSMLFNTLGVSAVAGLATSSHIKLEHWPILRDCVMFSLNLIILMIITWDSVITWYESWILIVILVFYFAVMFQSQRLRSFILLMTKGKRNYDLETYASNKYAQTMDFGNFICSRDEVCQKLDDVKPPIYTIAMMYQKSHDTSLEPPTKEVKRSKQSKFQVFWWVFTSPIHAILVVTIPQPRLEKKLYLLSFGMSMVMLAFTSYIIFWMISVIGYTFNIPESIMGMTLLAAGGCLPEATSSFVMARKGNGDIGVSNSLGANSLAILYSLGVPWFLKIMMQGGPFTNASINIYSDGMEFVVISLIGAVGALYFVLRLSAYKLRKTVGAVLLVTYSIFVTFPILIEMNVLFPSDNKC